MKNKMLGNERFASVYSLPMGATPSLYIIEDNDDNLLLYEWIFTRYLPSYSFHLFSDGLFLQQKMDSVGSKPDLILLDLKMPYIDGLELLVQLKNDLRWKTIPVVIFTHSTSPKERDACYKAGASGFINKEISVNGIKEQLQDICRRWL